MKKILILFLFLQPLPSYCVFSGALAFAVGLPVMSCLCGVILHQNGCCPDKPDCCKKPPKKEGEKLINEQPTKKEAPK